MSDPDTLREALIPMKLWSIKTNSRLIPGLMTDEYKAKWGWVDAEVRPASISLMHKLEGTNNFRVVIDGFEFVACGDAGSYDTIKGLVLAHG